MLGERVPRREDARLLVGNGQYLADVDLPDLKHIALLRSPVAHGNLIGVATERARALDGVIAVFTGADMVKICRQPLRHRLLLPGIRDLEWYPLAVDRVRYVGEPVVAVVAETRAIAEDACELIELEIAELDAVTDVDLALEPGAPALFPGWENNELLHLEAAYGSVDERLASAPHTLSERFTHHRVSGTPLEGHGAVASLDAASQELTVYASNQCPHHLKSSIAEVCGLTESSVRVVVPDMGGGFGNKQAVSRDEMLVAVVATQVPFPVRWVQDRKESLTAAVHAHEAYHDVDVAFDDDGRILALKARITADLGTPMLYPNSLGPHLVSTAFMTGAYDIQDYAYELRATVTNKCPSGGYRGYGQPEAHYSIERMVDLIAAHRGLDPAEVRRRNMIPDAPRPYVSAVGAQYDIGSISDSFERLLREMDYDGWRQRQRDAAGEGRLLGIGVSALVEASASNLFGLAGRFGAYEVAHVSVLPDGKVTVAVGTKSQGQGHLTSFAQCAASVFGIPVGNVHVRDGDTELLPYGTGTWGSRSATMGGGAVMKAAGQLKAKMHRIAASMLGCPPEEVEPIEGAFSGTAGKVMFEEVAAAAWWMTFLVPPDLEPGLTAITVYDNRRTSPIPDERGQMNLSETYGFASTGVVVEVDPNTGRTTILDALMIHDCGTMINPMLVDGQLQGGFAQGLGTVLHEELVYEDHQIRTRNLHDYTIPTFVDVPRLRIIHEQTPSSIEGGFRGAGEGPIIATTAVVATAVADALASRGATANQTNLGPQHVRRLLREAGVDLDFSRPVPT